MGLHLSAQQGQQILAVWVVGEGADFLKFIDDQRQRTLSYPSSFLGKMGSLAQQRLAIWASFF